MDARSLSSAHEAEPDDYARRHPGRIRYAEHPRTRNRTYTRDQWAQLLSIRLKERGITKGAIGVEGYGPTDLLKENPAARCPK